MDRTKLPNSIRFNALDRYYVIPETEDETGVYFPMALVIGIDLKNAPTRDQVVEALQALDAKFPQFRLGYTLDYVHERWQKVPDSALAAHLAGLVEVGKSDESGDHDRLVAQTLPTNPDPLSCPIKITLHGQTLLVKQQHSFGDGRFVMQLIAYVLLAIYDRAKFNALPILALNMGLPIWRVIWQTPQQGLRVLQCWLKTFKSSVEDFTTTPTDGHPLVARMAVRSGTAMTSTRSVIDAASLDLLDKMRREISGDTTKVTLNTLLQVLFAHRLIELGLQEAAVTYTLPVDLKRYLKQPTAFYPGNLAGQLRVKLPASTPLDWRTDCSALQQKIDQQLKDYLGLSTIPSEWLLGLAGRKTYRKFNREWLVKSTESDKRLFVMTNLGKLDADWAAVEAYRDSSNSISFAVPLMGSPPLVIALFTLNGQGHLTTVYNPALLTAEQIEQVNGSMTTEWLAAKAAN